MGSRGGKFRIKEATGAKVIWRKILSMSRTYHASVPVHVYVFTFILIKEFQPRLGWEGP